MHVKVLSAVMIFIIFIFSGCIVNESGLSQEDELHDEYSVEISGNEMKGMTVREIAEKWGIDADQLLSGMKEEFSLKGDYSADTVLDDIRSEYKFSPAMVKGIAENILQKVVSGIEDKT